MTVLARYRITRVGKIVAAVLGRMEVAAAGVGLVVYLSLAAAGIGVEARPTVMRQGAASPPQRDCVRGEPAPWLGTAPGAARPVFQRKSATEAVETLRIDPRTDVTIRHFGCAHFALEVTFAIKAARPRSTSAWLSQAAQLLERLPVADDQRAIVGHIARSLRRAASGRYAFGMPLSITETATLTVDLHRDRAGTRLVVLYDMAL